MFRWIKPWLFRGAKAGAKTLRRAALQTGVTFFQTLLTTPKDIKTLFLNTFGRLYLLRWQVGVVANANARHHAPDAPALKDANAQHPRFENLGRKTRMRKRRAPIKRIIFA